MTASTTRPPSYPVNLVVAGKRVLVVGAGGVAVGKVSELASCGAVVDVVAPHVDERVAAAATGTVQRRRFEAGDTAGYRLVVTATDDPAVNAAVSAEADAAGIWVNSADDPANCTFTLPARVRRGNLLLTVSTEGTSPAVATWIRRQLEDLYGPEHSVLLDLVAEVRGSLRAQGVATEGLGWSEALDSGTLELVREGRLAEAKERLEACLSSPSA